MFDDEKRIQKAFVSWMRVQFPHLLFTIAPAGQTRGSKLMRIIAGKEAKDMGYTKGCPDIIIFKSSGGFHGLCIEMKTKDGRLSSEQAEFKTRLQAEGYASVVCHGFEEAVNEVKRYLTL